MNHASSGIKVLMEEKKEHLGRVSIGKKEGYKMWSFWALCLHMETRLYLLPLGRIAWKLSFLCHVDAIELRLTLGKLNEPQVMVSVTSVSQLLVWVSSFLHVLSG